MGRHSKSSLESNPKKVMAGKLGGQASGRSRKEGGVPKKKNTPVTAATASKSKKRAKNVIEDSTKISRKKLKSETKRDLSLDFQSETSPSNIYCRPHLKQKEVEFFCFTLPYTINTEDGKAYEISLDKNEALSQKTF
ncbi:MAG: hypothetical protein Q9191_000097 [Dirinaria sp. TL-2023a]